MSWSRPLYRVYERRVVASLDPARRPGHVGIILDGHRRFARAAGMVDYADSYRSGMQKFEEFLGWCRELRIPAVTAWVLSTENLERPAEELDPYLEVLLGLFGRVPTLAAQLGFSLRVIGSLDVLPAPLVAAAKEAEEQARGGGWQLTIAMGYGGRQEIVDACRALVGELVEEGTPPDELAERVDAASVAAHLYTADLPDPDLVIRTSGEARLSGFLLWQAAYAEYVFVDPYWPAFRRVDFLRALRDYARRERRFGREPPAGTGARLRRCYGGAAAGKAGPVVATGTDPRPPLPLPRGPLSELVVDHLRRPVQPLPPCPTAVDDPLSGDDFQLALYACYELHYRSFAGVDEAWEWDPGLLGLRRDLESLFEMALFALVPDAPPVSDAEAELHGIVAAGGGPSLSAHLAARGTRRQLEEFAIHRSAYQLKEADPHTWAIPRLAGGPKAAMVEIQADEYGGGVESEMHATLFGDTMAALGLDPTYGAYLDRLPGTTLATVNLVSMFGLHRRWRGALVGHLAVFEMTSVQPMARYARALARLGLGPDARRFYDVHVEADVRHAVVAAGSMAGALAAREPALAADVVFGARALMAVEARFSGRLLEAWAAGRSSLLEPAPCPVR